MPEIRITRTIDATPEQVFAAWTEPSAIASWYGPPQFHAPADRIHVDLRPGGRWELTMVRDDGRGEFTIGYDIVDVRAPELLVMRSDPTPQLDTQTVVRVELNADGDRTHLTLTDGPMPDHGAAGAEAAYHAALDKLAQHALATR